MLETEQINNQLALQNNQGSSINSNKSNKSNLNIIIKVNKKNSGGGCCGNKDHLNKTEFDYYNNLFKQSNEPFNINNPEHQQYLTLIKNFYLSNNKIPESKFEWRKLGFQSSGPENDLKTVGVITLKFINFFMDYYPSNFVEMTKKEDFSFGLVCVKLILYSRIFLKLIEQNELKTQTEMYKINNADKKMLKAFGVTLSANQDGYFIILCKAMLSLWEEFNKKFNPKKPHLAVLLLDPITKEVIGKIEETLVFVYNNYELMDINLNNEMEKIFQFK